MLNQMPNSVVRIAMLHEFELMGFNGFATGPVVTLFRAVWELFADMAGDASVVEAVA
jgi:hypothetical protein